MISMLTTVGKTEFAALRTAFAIAARYSASCPDATGVNPGRANVIAREIERNIDRVKLFMCSIPVTTNEAQLKTTV